MRSDGRLILIFFQFVPSRYERASLIVISDNAFGKANLFTQTVVPAEAKSHVFVVLSAGYCQYPGVARMSLSLPLKPIQSVRPVRR
jgi:hypothetical protein